MTRTIAATLAVVLVAGGAATAWWLATSRTTRAEGPSAVPVATARVVRTTLTTTTQLSGTLGYADPRSVVPQLAGTITALPAVGTVITRGQPLYEIDGRSVFLFLGRRPPWRPFSIGMTPGRDIRELEQNLTTLGYGDGLTVDDTFTWLTDQAVRDWQYATRQLVTGTVELGRVVFAPGPLRVISDSTPLGAPAEPVRPVLTASSPDPVVSVPVPATQTYLVHRGDRVTITVPSGASSPGRVTGISPIASTGDNGGGASPGAGGPPQASVPVTVTLDTPTIAAHLDQAPVTITVLDRTVHDVLAVPITSLVALAGGGYGVWVQPAAPAVRRLVAVAPGLFANTLVQVSSPGLRSGDRVEVPAP